MKGKALVEKIAPRGKMREKFYKVTLASLAGAAIIVALLGGSAFAQTPSELSKQAMANMSKLAPPLSQDRLSQARSERAKAAARPSGVKSQACSPSGISPFVSGGAVAFQGNSAGGCFTNSCAASSSNCTCSLWQGTDKASGLGSAAVSSFITFNNDDCIGGWRCRHFLLPVYCRNLLCQRL